MAFKDLREFISALKGVGDLQEIEREVDWNLEAGAIMRLAYERQLPAPLFTNIKGYPPGYRLMGGTLATLRRVAIAMGLDPESPCRTLVEEYIKRSENRIKPILVKDGPCKENILTGEDVDLAKFPVPILHEGDGGRYMTTWHVDAIKDPDTGWVNWAMYRSMLLSKNTLAKQIAPRHHGGLIFRAKYEPRNQVMPIAMAIGVEPLCNLAAAADVPAGMDEVDVAGALRQEPVELIKCETVDLEVPANAEIVIEAEVQPGERVSEGPFSEFPGYVGPAIEGLVLKVKCITHRNDPILTSCCEGVPVSDGHATKSVCCAAELLKLLRERALPVVDLHLYPEGALCFVVVSINPIYGNIAHGIASTIWSSGTITPYVVVVDSDVDPSNMNQVMHAMATKCHPYRGIHKTEHTRGNRMWPFTTPQERRYSMGSCVYFDCTWPIDWDPSQVPAKAAFDTNYPKELQEKVLKNWTSYGYKEL